MAKSKVDQLREELEAARTQLREGVEGAVADKDPRVLKDRAKDSVRSFVRGEIENLRSFVQYEDGSWKIDVLVKGTACVLGAVAGIKVLKAIFGKKN